LAEISDANLTASGKCESTRAEPRFHSASDQWRNSHPPEEWRSRCGRRTRHVGALPPGEAPGNVEFASSGHHEGGVIVRNWKALFSGLNPLYQRYKMRPWWCLKPSGSLFSMQICDICPVIRKNRRETSLRQTASRTTLVFSSSTTP
jgi:hypothetical protein